MRRSRRGSRRSGEPVTQALCRQFSQRNALAAATTLAPGQGFPLLTLNQIRMTLRIAAVSGMEPRKAQALAVGAALGRRPGASSRLASPQRGVAAAELRGQSRSRLRGHARDGRRPRRLWPPACRATCDVADRLPRSAESTGPDRASGISADTSHDKSRRRQRIALSKDFLLPGDGAVGGLRANVVSPDDFPGGAGSRTGALPGRIGSAAGAFRVAFGRPGDR